MGCIIVAGYMVRNPLGGSLWTHLQHVVGLRGLGHDVYFFEFTVANDQNVRLRSGWFSERSASYLTVAKPVIAQDTGFGRVLPTGEGLFAFNNMEEIVAAFDTI
jgi:hypothetical protein